MNANTSFMFFIFVSHSISVAVDRSASIGESKQAWGNSPVWLTIVARPRIGFHCVEINDASQQRKIPARSHQLSDASLHISLISGAAGFCDMDRLLEVG